MIILSFGMPKSASSFAFQLVSEMAGLAGYDQLEIRRKYLVGHQQNAFQMLNPGNCGGLFQSIPDDEIYTIKTHGSFCEPIEHGLSHGKIKALATYRDPLDMAVSLLDAGEKERLRPTHQQRKDFAELFTLSDAIKVIDWSVDEADKWLSNPFTMNVPYTEVFNGAEQVAIKLQNFLGLGENAVVACNKYLLNKNKILEYNVGGLERWKNRLTSGEADLLMSRYEGFRTTWL